MGSHTTTGPGLRQNTPALTCKRTRDGPRHPSCPANTPADHVPPPPARTCDSIARSNFACPSTDDACRLHRRSLSLAISSSFALRMPGGRVGAGHPRMGLLLAPPPPPVLTFRGVEHAEEDFGSKLIGAEGLEGNS